MQYYDDLYGVRADQHTFLERERELIDPVAERLMEILDIELESAYSESSGGFCYENAFDEDIEEYDLDVNMHPNHIIEPDGDYWLEENYKEFALLLSIGSERKELVEEARRKILGADSLNLTLIRSSHSPNLGGKADGIVLFSLKPESADR